MDTRTQILIALSVVLFGTVTKADAGELVPGSLRVSNAVSLESYGAAVAARARSTPWISPRSSTLSSRAWLPLTQRAQSPLPDVLVLRWLSVPPISSGSPLLAPLLK